MQPALVRRTPGGHRGWKNRGRGTKPETLMDSDSDSLWAQRLHLLPEPQRGSPSSDRLPHSVSPTRFLSSSLHHPELRQRSPAGPKSKRTTRSLALSLEGDSHYWIRGQASCQKPKTERPEDRIGNRNQRTKYPSNEDKLRNQHQEL